MNKIVTITFDASESENDLQVFRTLKADKAYKALYEITQLLRNHDKYGQQEANLENYISSIRIDISNIIINAGIDLDGEYN